MIYESEKDKGQIRGEVGKFPSKNAALMRHKRCITTGKAGSKSITFTLKGLATSRPQASKRTL